MKNLIMLLLIAVVTFGCGSHGMTCGGCERTVKNAVGELPGVQEVTASHTDSVAVVIFDKTQAGFDAMKSAINDKGYKAIDYKVVE